MLFFGYLTLRAFNPTYVWYDPYISPTVAPPVFTPVTGYPGSVPVDHAWFGAFPAWWPAFLPQTPAFFLPALAIAFRFTCYYYRGAYYKAFALTPPSCAVVGIAKGYRGEKARLVFQNLHRYTLYGALLLLVFLWWEGLVLTVAVSAAGCGRSSSGERPNHGTTNTGQSTGQPPRGGQLVVSVRTEPQTFNRYTRRDLPTDLISTFINGKLVRINRLTQEVEPWLAASWTRSDDGRRYTVTLREGVTFSDGQLFTADDVVFSFDALYNAKSGNVLAEAVKVGGKPLKAVAADSRTVVIEFPEAFAPGLRLLDNLPILPKHRLDGALKAGQFASAWGVGTPPSEIVGLGPFALREYVPGQRTVLSRNPRYFRKDDLGVQLPYLDRVVVEVVPDQNGELLRLEAGEIDVTSGEIRADDYAPLKRAADAGRLQLFDLGVGYDADSFWFNLKPGAFAGDPREAWIQRDELRRAISLAVSRQHFADTVYLGAAVPVYGPITPANRQWYSASVPQTPHDPAQARALLASIGLVDRNGDGRLEDGHGTTARFTLMVQKGRTLQARRRGDSGRARQDRHDRGRRAAGGCRPHPTLQHLARIRGGVLQCAHVGHRSSHQLRLLDESWVRAHLEP